MPAAGMCAERSWSRNETGVSYFAVSVLLIVRVHGYWIEPLLPE